MIELRKSEDRGYFDHGWLKTYHSFSFASYFDPTQLGFSDIRVINDDIVKQGGGFGTHPHHDMEIFTYVLKGALEHKDSMGTGSVIHPGDVQMMSAGSGITHSEFNHSADEAVHLLQIWIVPNKKAVKPRYQQVHFEDSQKRGKLKLIISPEGEDGSLSCYQDIRVYAALLDGAEKIDFELKNNRFAYIHIAKGELNLNGTSLKAGDGAKIRNEAKLELTKGKSAEFLLFDLRPKENPSD